MKRLVICCDGTWNTPDQEDELGRRVRTNVTRLAQTVAQVGASGTPQRMFYTSGVGTSTLDHWVGGVFGVGLSARIKEAYAFVVEEFTPGDELFLFGFSRGAYTARSLAGLIRNSGVLRRGYANRLDDAYELYRDRSNETHPRSIEAQLFRITYSYEPRIKFIGVWDTVGALGIPDLPVPTGLSAHWKFHDVDLSTTVKYAYQALAIDERRAPFSPTLWDQQDDAPPTQVLEQVWFSGAHSNVGGGLRDSALSDITLLWMLGKAQAQGLALDLSPIAHELVPDALGELQDSMTWYYRLLGDGTRYIPERRLRRNRRPGQGQFMNTHEQVASTARIRFDMDPAYHPQNLRDYFARGGPVVDVRIR